MYARVFTTQTPPEKIEETIRIWESIVAPKLKQAHGFKGAYVMGDRKTGKGLTITLWETEADAIARDTTGESQQLASLFTNVFAAPPTLDMFEVAIQV